MVKFFSVIITIQLFYSFGITVLSHSLAPYVSDTAILSDYKNVSVDMANLSSSVEASTKQQLNIPLVDLGALVFYSGNIIVDMMMNFFFAVPSIATLIVNGLLLFVNVDSYLATQLKLFLFALITITYFISLLFFLVNVRSRGGAIV